MPLEIKNPSRQSCALPEGIEALADLDFDPRDTANCKEAGQVAASTYQ